MCYIIHYGGGEGGGDVRDLRLSSGFRVCVYVCPGLAWPGLVWLVSFFLTNRGSENSKGRGFVVFMGEVALLGFVLEEICRGRGTRVRCGIRSAKLAIHSHYLYAMF